MVFKRYTLTNLKSHTGGVFSGTVAEKGAFKNMGGWSWTSQTAAATLAMARRGFSEASLATKLMT